MALQLHEQHQQNITPLWGFLGFALCFMALYSIYVYESGHEAANDNASVSQAE